MSDPFDRPTSVPRVAVLLCAVLLLFVVVVLVLGLAYANHLDRRTVELVSPLVTVVVVGIPALIGASYAGRAATDLRNGMVVEKSRQGARQAIEESRPVLKEAVTQAVDEAQVLTRTGPVITAEVQALQRLLATTEAQTEALTQVVENTARIAGRRASDRPTV